MTEQELIDEFEKKVPVEQYDQYEYTVRWLYFKQGYSLAQETIAELESRLEQSVDISVVNELNETIKAKDAEIEKLKSTFAGYENFKENERQLKAIAEAREIIEFAIKESKDQRERHQVDFDDLMEFEEKAKAWLESNK